MKNCLHRYKNHRKINYKILLSIMVQCIAFQLMPNSNFMDSISYNGHKNYKIAMLLSGHIASNSKAINAKFVTNFILKNHPKYTLGFNAAYEKIWLSDNVGIPKNITTDLAFGTVGLNLQYKINQQLFFQPEFSLLIGKQKTSELISTPATYNQYGYVTSYKYSEKNYDQDVLGAHIEQHLLFYPKKAKGLILGVSLFERVLNAKYYDGDFGVCGYIGIDF